MVAFVAVLAGFAVMLLTVSAAIRQTARPHAENEVSGTAAREEDHLVVTVGSPLPPRCLLCGEPSSVRVPPSALLRNLGAHPDAALALSGSGFPLCDVHSVAEKRFTCNVAFASSAAFLVLVANVLAVPAVTLAPGATAFAAVFAYSVARRPGKLFVGRTSVRHVHVHGVAPALLDSLPSTAHETV